MADKEVWNLGGPIGAPAAGDRIPLATAAGAGGYSLRGSFVWKDATGKFNADGPILGGGSATSGVLGFAVNYSGADVLNTFGGLFSSGATAIGFAVKPLSGGAGWASSTGFGAFGRCGLSMDATALRVGFAGVTTTANGTAIALTEVMSLLASGNFGLGVSSPAVRFHAKSTGEIARFETTTARGGGACYTRFADPTGSKGYVGYTGGGDDFYVFNELSSALLLGTNNAVRWAIATGGTFYPVSDNAYSMGTASNRVSVYWGVSGAINTSDEREKKWRGGLTKDELLAGERVLEELGFYQWLDAIAAKKGKAQARFHFGARAQRVWGIFAELGLVDPIGKKGPGKTPYAFLCYDAWEEERTPEMVDVEIPATRDADGNEDAPARIERQATGKQLVTLEAGNRYGLRTDQFALFLVAVIHELRKRDAARIDALEQAIADLKKALPAA